MRIEFLGATGTVTGSRYLVTHGNTRILVDCGLFQGFKNLRLRNWAEPPVDPKKLDAVLLTHAHLDHSGYLPLLVKQGFRGAIYATRPTIDLCEILLPDSGFLQEEEARTANRHGFSKHKPALPLYTVEDAKRCLSSFRRIGWRKSEQISRKGLGTLEFEFHPAGHLLGAASVVIRSDSSSIAFSGDLGRASDPLIRKPEPRFGVDHLVIESTYGDRRHPDRDPESDIREVVLRTWNRGGILLIPSFAVGRAQLVLLHLLRLKRRKEIPDIPVYLNSPMAAEANQAFSAHAEELRIPRDELADLWRSVRTVSSREESIALNRSETPSIILAASGMATGGRVLHHLKKVAPDPKNTILFAGYQAGGTRGDLMVRGADTIKIHGAYWPVRAEVVQLENLSAHADSAELLEWTRGLQRKPKRVFVTHGEPEAAEALRRALTDQLGLEAEVPEYRQEIELG
jgi:metallo-beta-lactamase family protein